LKIVARHHPYEAKSFTDDLDKYARALNRDAESWPSSTLPVLIVRLSETANLAEHAHWAHVFVNRSDTKVAGIVLFQSTVAQNIENDTTSIQNAIDVGWREGLPSPDIRITLTSGFCSDKQTPHVMTTNGKSTPLFDIHVFYQSEIFTIVDFDPTTGAAAAMNVSPGRTLHGGFRIGDQEVILSSKSRVPDQLVLFS
jgi:hypothetical protein